jgi:hypothetical protein
MTHTHREVCPIACWVVPAVRLCDRVTEDHPVTITVERWYSGWPRLDSIAAYTANQRREVYKPTITHGARWKPQDSLRGDGWANGVWWGYDR